MAGVASHINVTADAVVVARSGVFLGVNITASADLCTVVLYDNASAASGTILATLKAPINDTRNFHIPNGYVFTNGIYADVTGTTPAVTVVFV